jgi:hypothetical protein
MEPPYDQVDFAEGDEHGLEKEKEREQRTLGFWQEIFKAGMLYYRFYFFIFYEM